MVSNNTGIGHTLGIVVEIIVPILLLLAGTAGAAPPTIIKPIPVYQYDIMVDSIQNLTIFTGVQNGVLRWIENDKILLTEQIVNWSDVVTYTYRGAAAGTYKITANISNNNGSNIQEWIIKVRPRTYLKGSRIWDGSKPDNFSLTYSWDPMSFSGFYYSAKDDVGTENLKIRMDSYSSRIIEKGNLVYTTSPQEVSFTSSNFGKYQVIGFLADKYFAGYTVNTGKYSNKTLVTRPTTDFEGKSTLSQGELHEVLIDDDIKRMISVGSTISLQDGYVLKAKDIDFNARTMLLSLLKNGNEVDISPLSEGETYVYSKTVDGVENLPFIMVRFDSVFSGQELQVAFIKGLFQISNSPEKIKSGNKYGSMEVVAISNNGILMNNHANVSLNKSSAVNIMQNFNIKVANNDSVRFTPSVEETAYQEIRSAVYRSTDPIPITQWTPYNFGMNTWLTNTGFYYDIDEDVGSERLTLKIPIYGRSISDKMLQYSTSVREVNFKYSGFGKYNVMGFMADKYFAGFNSNTGKSSVTGKMLITRPTTDFDGINTFSNGTIHKVLMDDDIKRTISAGSTIALKEGYALKVIDIDFNARTMLLSLLKDGVEVDISPISSDETYIYTKIIGNESLPLIMARFDNIFSGQELQLGFLRGMFQISEIPTAVNIGDHFNMMEVTEVNNNTIVMNNNGSIGLDKNKDDAILGKIRLKVADNDDLRFYFAVDLAIDTIFPVISSVTLNNRFPIEGETVLISVNATDNVGVTGVRANEAVLSVRGGKTFTWSGSITASEGTHSVNVSARDEAGHIAWNNSTRYEATTQDEIPDSNSALPDIHNAIIFRGKVTIDGNAVPDGTKVEAKSGTVLRGMDSEGTSSGNYDLAVFAKKEILTFYVNNRSAQTYDLSRKDKGRIIILNLSITTGGGISGMKFNDSDGDGIKDQGESGLANWTIVLKNSSGSLKDTTITKNNGSYTFSGLAAGNYAVEEVLLTGWMQTFPQAPGVYNVTVSDGEIIGIDFGNNLRQKVSTGANAWRDIKKESLRPGGSTSIIVRINSDINQALALREFVPEGWNITRNSDDNADLKNSVNEWVWSNVTPGISRNVNYTITAPKNAAAGTYYINGTIANGSGLIAIVDGDKTITVDMVGYYRRLGGNPDIVDTRDMLKAMDDWRNRKVPAGFIRSLTNQELSEIINEWSGI